MWKACWDTCQSQSQVKVLAANCFSWKCDSNSCYISDFSSSLFHFFVLKSFFFKNCNVKYQSTDWSKISVNNALLLSRMTVLCLVGLLKHNSIKENDFHIFGKRVQLPCPEAISQHNRSFIYYSVIPETYESSSPGGAESSNSHSSEKCDALHCGIVTQKCTRYSMYSISSQTVDSLEDDCPLRHPHPHPSSRPACNLLLVGQSCCCWWFGSERCSLSGHSFAYSLFCHFCFSVFIPNATRHQLEGWSYLPLRRRVDGRSNEDIKHLWLAVNKSRCVFFPTSGFTESEGAHPLPCVWAERWSRKQRQLSKTFLEHLHIQHRHQHQLSRSYWVQ